MPAFDFLLDGVSDALISDLSDFVEEPVSCLLRRCFPFCKGVVVTVVAAPADVPVSKCVVIVVAGSSFCSNGRNKLPPPPKSSPLL